jgi:hypothetical protein
MIQAFRKPEIDKAQKVEKLLKMYPTGPVLFAVYLLKARLITKAEPIAATVATE